MSYPTPESGVRRYDDCTLSGELALPAKNAQDNATPPFLDSPPFGILSNFDFRFAAFRSISRLAPHSVARYLPNCAPFKIEIEIRNRNSKFRCL
jgi:hypothetical protein